MATCPWCDTDFLVVKGNAFQNADTYNNPNLVVTECCDRPVSILPVRSYRVKKYEGNATEDDWGNPIKKPDFVFKTRRLKGSFTG